MDSDIFKNFIDSKGGVTKFAQLLNLPERTGAQTVSNWKRRGIPKAVMFDHPRIFAPLVRKLREKA